MSFFFISPSFLSTGKALCIIHDNSAYSGTVFHQVGPPIQTQVFYHMKLYFDYNTVHSFIRKQRILLACFVVRFSQSVATEEQVVLQNVTMSGDEKFPH